LGTDNGTAAARIAITLGRDFKEIDAARARIREFCEKLFMGQGQRSSLDDFYLAITEAMNNAVEHSGANAIEIIVTAAEAEVMFTMITPGTRFDPTAKSEMPDLDSTEGLPEGGFGLAMIQELMDSVAYEYREGCNIFTLKKTIRSR